MRSDIVPGGVFPDYQLPDHTGTPRRLSEIQGDDPMILTLARGHYCPKEHQQHLDLAAMQRRIAVAYTTIATIAANSLIPRVVAELLVHGPAAEQRRGLVALGGDPACRSGPQEEQRRTHDER